MRARASSSGGERLQFARSVVTRQGIDLTDPEGPGLALRWLHRAVSRVSAEYAQRSVVREHLNTLADPAAQSVRRATMFRDRGPATDTSLLTNFALEQALGHLQSEGLITPGTISRIAVIGPGLDFADKRDGHDFYPVQTVQPFGVIDSLRHLGLAAPGFRLTTFDLSPRVNHHLQSAAEFARSGRPYVLHLPRDLEPIRWSQELVEYWERAGDDIGSPTVASAPPGNLRLLVRGVGVDPSVVERVEPVDLNIVFERQALDQSKTFDLVIATNVLLYYDEFEQSLALSNISAMLRPGGMFLSNTAAIKLPSVPLGLVGYTDVVYTDRPDGDRIFWCRRL